MRPMSTSPLPSLTIVGHASHPPCLPQQYIGAVVVAVGLVVVLLPTFEHPSGQKSRNPVLWSFVLMFSCVPMCLSRYYAL
jgi:hypothetical protein